MSDVEKKRSSSLFWLLVGALGFVFAFLLWPTPKKKHPLTKGEISSSSLHPVDTTSELVNKHLWITNQAQELAEQRVAVQNTLNSPKVGDSIWPKGIDKSKQYGVDHSPDSNETTAFEDLNRYKKELNTEKPDNVIQAQLRDQDRQREYEKAYREAYAKQFIENARRAGYDVRLNDDMVVVSVRPIRNPSSSDLGPQAK